MAEAAKSGGLEGVSVADTVLSDVDGERGRLVLRGHDVEHVAGRIRFEQLCALLWSGALPTPVEEARLRASLGAARVRAFESLGRLGDALQATDGMDALRAALAHQTATGTLEHDRVALTGAAATYVAAWTRTLRGEAPIAPDPNAAHASDVLRMMTGSTDDARAAALEAYLVTVSDHGMNASTFAARVVASTASDVVSAVVAAVGALKGPLHGGAPGPVLDMLDAITTADRAERWLEDELLAGRRIMGMGHRIYRVRDPRAAVLEKAIERLEIAGVHTQRLSLARAVERAAEGILRARHPTRPLHANVEFYTAVLLDAIGIPRTSFAPTFAVGRVVGWLAHFEEQQRTGRLLRPASRYVGPAPATASQPRSDAS